MLKKIYRLAAVRLNAPKLIKTNLFNLKTAKNNQDYCRFGFVISKKLDKKAVVRNRVKRNIVRSIEEIFDKIKSGYDFVFYPNRKILDVNDKTIVKELYSALKKEGLINA